MPSASELFELLGGESSDHAATASLVDGLKEVNFADEKGRTLLHQAAVGGNIMAVQRLLQRNADPNVRTNHGSTPLHNAVNHGHDDLARLLVAHGAEAGATNRFGRTAAEQAGTRQKGEVEKN